MDVIFNAGGVPLPEDPLYPYIYGHPKAVLPIAGRPMIQWTLDALAEARQVSRIVLVGLNEKSGLKSRTPITYLPNQGRWSENLRAAAAEIRKMDPRATQALLVSPDLPGLRSESVDGLLARPAQPGEQAVVTLVGRDTLRRTLPKRRFAWIHLAEGDFAAGGLAVCRLDLLLDEEEREWEKFVIQHDHPSSLAGELGAGTSLRYLFGRLSIDELTRQVEKGLGLRVGVWVCPQAGPALRVQDADMLVHLEGELKKRARQAARPGGRKPAARS